MFLSNRGIFVPALQLGLSWTAIFGWCAAGALLVSIIQRIPARQREATGRTGSLLPLILAIAAPPAVIVPCKRHHG